MFWFFSFKTFWKTFLTFFWLIDRRWHQKRHCNDNDAEKTQKRMRKRCKSIRKRFKRTWKSIESIPKNQMFSDGPFALDLFEIFGLTWIFDTLIFFRPIVFFFRLSFEFWRLKINYFIHNSIVDRFFRPKTDFSHKKKLCSSKYHFSRWKIDVWQIRSIFFR